MAEDENVCYAISNPRAALAWTTLAFFAGFAGVSAFGPIVPKLKQAMDVDPFLMGILAASPALTGSLLRIPFGAMVDRMGGKKPILILLLLAAAGVAGITLMFSLVGTPRAAHYPFFLIFGILCGCGIAVFSVGVPAVSYWYPQRKQGTALAVYGGLGNLAPGMFALLLPFLVVSLGFTWSYVLWLVALLAMTFLVFARMKDAPYFQYKEMGMDIDPDALLLACGEELVPTGKAMDSIRKAGADWRTWVLTYLLLHHLRRLHRPHGVAAHLLGRRLQDQPRAGRPVHGRLLPFGEPSAGVPAASPRTNWAACWWPNFPSWWWRPAPWC